jgi:hypothetical protein
VNSPVRLKSATCPNQAVPNRQWRGRDCLRVSVEDPGKSQFGCIDGSVLRIFVGYHSVLFNHVTMELRQ